MVAADTVAVVEEGRGGKGPVPEHRKGPARFEEEAPAGRAIRGNEEATSLRKALGEKKE